MPKGLYGSESGVNLSRVVSMEFIGALALFFVGIAPIVAGALGLVSANSLEVKLAFGFTLGVFIFIFGPVSGAHFNPGVTIGLAVIGKITWKYALFYVIAHVAAGIVASLMLWLVFGNAARDKARLGVPTPGEGVSGYEIFVTEFIASFFFILVIMFVANLSGFMSQVGGFAVGFWFASLIMAVAPITGASLNPARAGGPMVVSGVYDNWLAYISAPILAGILAAIVHEKVFANAKKPDSVK